MEQEKFETMERPPVVIGAAFVVASTFILNLFFSYNRYETLHHIDPAVLFFPIVSMVMAVLLFEPLFCWNNFYRKLHSDYKDQFSSPQLRIFIHIWLSLLATFAIVSVVMAPTVP